MQGAGCALAQARISGGGSQVWFGLAALVRFMEKVLGATKLSVSGLSVRLQVTSLCKFGHVTRVDVLFWGDSVAKIHQTAPISG